MYIVEPRYQGDPHKWASVLHDQVTPISKTVFLYYIVITDFRVF